VSNPYRSLQQAEAHRRFEQLRVTSYDVRLDLAADEATFPSLTTIRFTSTGGETFLDLKPLRVNEIRLNGDRVDPDLLDHGRLPLTTPAGENELVVDAVMRFRNDGEGLHRSVDPADGKHYVYGMSFMDAAPSIFACFDQPDLKAPYTFHVTAPTDWTVVGNAPGQQVGPGPGDSAPGRSAQWEFEQTQPLSTYFVTLVAGPWHVVHDEHDGIPLSISSRASIARHLDADLDELFTVTKQCFDEFHRLFGIRYPFGNYHQAFVPEFNAGAMENPGCVTFRDPYVFTSKVTRSQRILRAVTVAHEMAHQWFGNITTPHWWDDLWLNESFAEYMGNRVVADVTQYADAWVHNAHARRQWGLIADQRPSTHPVAGNGAVDASAALQDFDGISYNKGSSILKQLNATIGDEVFFAGVVDHFDRHRFGNATMHDLFASWENAGAGDLRGFTGNWLRTAGPDALVVDRAAGVVRRTPPAGAPAERAHVFRAAVARPGDAWRIVDLTARDEVTPFVVGPDEAVVLDPFEDTWALVMPDETTTPLLPSLLPTTEDPRLRAGIWNNVRSAFHNAAIAPETALALVEAGIAVEDNDDALRAVLPWAVKRLAPLSGDPLGALDRVHAACQKLLTTAAPGSTVQLGAFRGAIDSATDVDLLQRWRRGEGLPDGLDLDLDLRWQLLVHLAAMGRTDPDELDRELAAEPTATSRVEHSRARASLPGDAAKAWAWQRFTGEVAASNYELEAIGLGMWRPGQEPWTTPYVDRYFAELPDTSQVHAGWVLADVAEAFFPITALDLETVGRAEQLASLDDLDQGIRRKLVDCADDLRRRIAVREKYAR